MIGGRRECLRLTPLSETATVEVECPLSETATVEGECPLSQTATVEGASVRCQRLLQ